ncbi:hypothetical protein OS493_039508, partial [Desmophyllum pertusum]
VVFQSPWWIEALHSVAARGMDSDLCHRIKDELSSTDMDLGSIRRPVQSVVYGPLRTAMLTVCAFCQVDDIFTEYESRIFGHQGMKGVDDQDLQPDESLDWHRHGNTGGLRAESEVERKEFKFLRALWFALRERVSCLDELDMCTTRLRLLLPGEPVTDNLHVIHPLQVEQQRLKFMSDRVVAQTELRKKLGQLLYLNNLAKTQTCHDGKNPEPCPYVPNSWVYSGAFSPVAIVFAVSVPGCCYDRLELVPAIGTTERSQTKEADENVTVKGSHSTKVEAVVRTLLTIKLTDSAAKCLVFSTWQEVLGVLAKALEENGIEYRHITGSRLFQSNLQTFKQDSLVDVLLLPLQTGSNGLNIIEATHVLLVEPAMNPAHELQAVGRVHRIGQTKPTHVYRFIIRGTVESRMYSLLQSKPTGCVRPGARDSENSSLTLSDLASLFTQDEEPDEEQCMPGSFGFQEESGPSISGGTMDI